MVTAGAIILDHEGFFAVMAFAAIPADVQVFHGYDYGPLLHFRKHFRIMAVGTGQTRFFMSRAIENYRTHRVPLECQCFPRADGVAVYAAGYNHYQTYYCDAPSHLFFLSKEGILATTS